jgi:hypothetical protein
MSGTHGVRPATADLGRSPRSPASALDGRLEVVDAVMAPAAPSSRLAGRARELAQGRTVHCVIFPWLLDGAEEDMRRKVLGVVSPLYRAVWRTRYLRASRWQPPASA